MLRVGHRLVFIFSLDNYFDLEADRIKISP